MVKKIEMVTDKNEKVTEKDLPDFEKGEPDVVIWGNRVFQKGTEHTSTDHIKGETKKLPTTYREVFHYTIPE